MEPSGNDRPSKMKKPYSRPTLRQLAPDEWVAKLRLAAQQQTKDEIDIVQEALRLGIPMDRNTYMAVSMLIQAGHQIRPYNSCKGTLYFELDGCMLAKPTAFRELGESIIRNIEMHWLSTVPRSLP